MPLWFSIAYAVLSAVCFFVWSLFFVKFIQTYIDIKDMYIGGKDD